MNPAGFVQDSDIPFPRKIPVFQTEDRSVAVGRQGNLDDG
jgi:hypothetical protein